MVSVCDTTEMNKF